MDLLVAPFVIPGYEPGPDGIPKTPEERKEVLQSLKQMRLVQSGIESPVAKSLMSGAMGGFFFLLFFLRGKGEKGEGRWELGRE